MAKKLHEVLTAQHHDLMTSDDLERDLGIKTESQRRWAREGKGPKRVRIGNRSYYHRQAVNQWLREQFEIA